MPYNDYGTIINAFKNAQSKTELVQALHHLGMDRLADNETALDILYDMTFNPLSKRRQEMNNELLNGQLEFAAQELAEQFKAILLHNLKLRRLQAALFSEESAYDNRRIEDDGDEDKEVKTPEEASLMEKLRQQDEVIAKLEEEIKATDTQIFSEQQELITTLSEQQQQQADRFKQGRDVLLEQLTNNEISTIAADDPDRESKIKEIQDKYSKDKIYISPNDTEEDKLLKNYNNIVEDYNNLLAETQQQIVSLSSAQAIKMTNGLSLAQLPIKMTMLDSYGSARFAELERQANGALDLYLNHRTKIEEINKSLAPEKVTDYNKYIQYDRDVDQLDKDVIRLDKEIDALDNEISRYNREHRNEEPTEEITKKLEEKAAKEQEITAKMQEMAVKGQAMVDLSATYEEVRKANIEANRLKNALGGDDPQTLARKAQNARLILGSITEQRAQLKSIKEHGKELNERQKQFSDNPIVDKIMSTLSRLFTSKSDKIKAYEKAVEEKAEIVLNMTSMDKAEIKQTQQQPSPAPIVVQPEPEQEQTRPGMSPRPNSSSGTV